MRGAVLVRARFCEPPPHVLVHVDQPDQVPTTQWTGSFGCTCLHAKTTTVFASATSLQSLLDAVETEKPKVLPLAHASGEPFFSYAMSALLLVHVPPSRS